MKNVCRKLKRFLAMLLITVTLVNTAVMSYSTAVNATSGVVTMGILDALYAMFGVSIGVGGQQAFFSQADLDYIITGARNGNVVQMGDYGDVDFSDSANVQRWLDSCAAVDGFLIGSATGNLAFGEDVAKQIRSNMLAIDMASYKNTGTCASTALYDYITNFRVDTGDGLLDMQDACNLFSGDNENDNNNNIDWTKYAAISALISAALISKATDLKDYFSSLVKPDVSEFTEYDTAFENTGFVPGQVLAAYSNAGDTDYKSGYYVVGSADINGSCTIITYGDCSNIFAFAYYNSDRVYFAYTSNSFKSYNSLSVIGRKINSNGSYVGAFSGNSVSSDNFIGTCLPLFSSFDDAKNYYETGDTSGILNLNDAYKNFKTNVGTASSALNAPLGRFLHRNPTADDFISKVNSAVDVCTDKGGTADVIPAVADVLSDGTADTDTDVDPDIPAETKDYTGVLGKIYNMLSKILDAILAIPTAIMELPDTIWSFFQNPLAAIKAAIDAIVSVLDPILEGVLAIPVAIMELPDLVWECFQDPITSIKSVVSSIPDALKAILDAILAIPEVIMALPELVRDCFDDALSRVDTMPDILDGILDGILILVNPVLGIYEVVKAIPAVLEDILEGVIALDPPDPVDPEPSTPHVGLLDGLLMLIYILFMLLKIFLHLLEFIINIFKIPADPGFITGDFRTGFDYIKSVELTGMGVSVYDFMMSLVHIMLIFGIVKVLRRRIEKIQM